MGGLGFQWLQGEDCRWLDRDFFDEEQVWQDREQEEVCLCQEEHLDCCHPEGPEGFGPEGLRRNQEGLRALQEGQGTLSVSIHEHAEASAKGVGMSTPLERRRFG